MDLVDSNDSSVTTHSASDRERKLCAVLVIVLACAAVGAACVNGRAFTAVPAFVPAFAGTTGTADALTAALLLSLYRIDGARELCAAGVAYLINALLIPPYALTFPGVIDAHGFIGNEQSAAWLWLVWHFAFPTIVTLGVWRRRKPNPADRRMRDVIAGVAVALMFCAAAVLCVTVGRNSLPVIISPAGFAPLWRWMTVAAALANLGASAILLRRMRPLPALHLWFVAAMIASALDAALNAIAPVRFSFPWYIGKAQTFLSATIVLVALFATWSELYARSALLARQLARTLAHGRVLAQKLMREHEIAAALQQASLPAMLPTVEGVALSATYRPALSDLEIGGDWYDAFILADGRLAITIGDVAGHGLAASIIMGKMRQSLRLAAQMIADPSLMLEIADGALRNEHPDTIVTAFAGLLDQESGQLVWASAGHPPAMIRQPDGSIVELSSFDPPLGLYGSVSATSADCTLQRSSLLVAYTDGLIEYDKDVIAGLARVREVIRDGALLGRADPAGSLFELVVGDSARDDVAVVTVCWSGVPAPYRRTNTARRSQAHHAKPPARL